MSGEVHIYAPKAASKDIRRHHCYDCKRKTRFIAFGYANPFLGEDWTCLNCGRQWQVADEMYKVSFNFCRPGAIVERKQNIANAKIRYRSMPPVSENVYIPNWMLE